MQPNRSREELQRSENTHINNTNRENRLKGQKKMNKENIEIKRKQIKR
jgi:hypothetical protein